MKKIIIVLFLVLVSSVSAQLKDGSDLTIVNDKLISMQKEGYFFDIESNCDIEFVGDVRNSLEWECKAKGDNHYYQSSSKDLFLKDNKICISEPIKETMISNSYYCVDYSRDYDWTFNKIARNIYEVTFKDEADPTLTITDFTSGTFNNTYYNATEGAVQLNASFNFGTYTSELIELDGGENSTILNFSWVNSTPVGTNLSISVWGNNTDWTALSDVNPQYFNFNSSHIQVLFNFSNDGEVVEGVDEHDRGQDWDIVFVTGDGTNASNYEYELISWLMGNNIYNFTNFTIVDDNWANLTSAYNPLIYYIMQSTSGGTLGTKLQSTDKGVISQTVSSWVNGRMNICQSWASSAVTTIRLYNDSYIQGNWTTEANYNYITQNNGSNNDRCQGTTGNDGIINITNFPSNSNVNYVFGYNTGGIGVGGDVLEGMRVGNGMYTSKWHDWTEFLKNHTLYLTMWAANITTTNIPSSAETIRSNYPYLYNFSTGFTNLTFEEEEATPTMTVSYNFSMEGIDICNGTVTLENTSNADDIYIGVPKYSLPYNWSSPNNSIEHYAGLPMKINFTVNNNASNGTEIICNWTTEVGFKYGNITIDYDNEITESIESNNDKWMIIPFKDRPWGINRTLYTSTTLPYAQDSSNEVAHSSLLHALGFLSEPFQEGWTGNNVDERAKKGRENAIGCFVNNFTSPPGKPMCERAKTYVLGWANRTLSSYSNVQSLSELHHVAYTYDLMFPNMTQEDYDLVGKAYHDITAWYFNLSNVRPDLDNDDIVAGGNGKGFGSSLYLMAKMFAGAWPENPTMVHNQSGKNMILESLDRQNSYLRGFKNDTWAKYQERWHYKFYSQYSIVENILFDMQYNLNPQLSQYQSALTSMGNEMATDLLDLNYNGRTIRGDTVMASRGISFGDSDSYEPYGAGSIIGFDLLTYYGLLSEDNSTKQAMAYLRKYMHDNEVDAVAQNNHYALFWYPVLMQQINETPVEPKHNYPTAIFDNANDIYTIRPTYTYTDDLVIQIDAGEEKGGGHSQAQGFYLYALGEEFFAAGQVPYEDDIRMDVWKNTVSFQNISQTVEGTGGNYNDQCGDTGYGAFYGMSSCPDITYPQDYPYGRNFPLEYGGDIEDYVASQNAEFAGAYVWRPNKQANQLNEYFVKFGDIMARRFTAKEVNASEGIFDNKLFYPNETTATMDGKNYTLTPIRNLNVHLSGYTLWSNTTDNILLINNTINACSGKTSCSGSNRQNISYGILQSHTSVNNTDKIEAYHWYSTGNEVIPSYLDGDDKGLSHGSKNIVFDTDNDKVTNYSNKNTTGYVLVWEDQNIGSMNTTSIYDGGTQVFRSNESISVFLNRTSDKIIVSLNTMKRQQGGMDQPKKINIIIDVAILNGLHFQIWEANQTNITDYTQSGDKISFIASSTQNSNYYTLTGTVDNSKGTNLTDTLIIPDIVQTGNLITVIARVKANESGNLTSAYAYLNINSSFTFLPETPQNQTIGSIWTINETTIKWYLVAPSKTKRYNLNISYTNNTNTYIGSSENVLISEGGNMAWVLVIIPLFITAFFLVVSMMLDPEKYWALKLGLMLLGFVFIFQAYQYGTLVIAEFYGNDNLINSLGDSTYLYGVVFWSILSIFLITYVYQIFMLFSGKKHKTGEYE